MDQSARLTQRPLNRWTLEPLFILLFPFTTLLAALLLATVWLGGYAGLAVALLLVLLVGASLLATLRGRLGRRRDG